MSTLEWYVFILIKIMKIIYFESFMSKMLIINLIA